MAANLNRRCFASARVAFVDTGHTHYSELLNDGAVVYGATRSTGQIEEGGGRPGLAVITVHDGVPSWRFKETGTAWPLIQIVAPADLRLATRPADPRQVPRPGLVEIVAKLFGDHPSLPVVSVDNGNGIAMTRGPEDSLWRARVLLAAGTHDVIVRCGDLCDTITLLVRPADDISRRAVLIALGRDIHSIGVWPDHGIFGTQLGPNKNGKHW